MGRVVDRSREHSARRQGRHPGAAAPTRGRQGGARRQDAARRRTGTYYALRAAEGVLPRDADWREVLTPEMSATRIEQTV